MTPYRLTYGASRFVIPREHPVRALMDEVEQAVRAGGRFVHIDTATHGPVERLIGAGVGVEVSVVPERPEDERSEDDRPLLEGGYDEL